MSCHKENEDTFKKHKFSHCIGTALPEMERAGTTGGEERNTTTDYTIHVYGDRKMRFKPETHYPHVT